MKADPVWVLISLYPRLKLIILQLLSLLAAGVGLVLKRNQSGEVPGGDENRVSRRAERFAIATTIRYRNVGQNRWYQGKTENISGSGVLFWAQKRVALKSRVEMIFPLFSKGSRTSGANVRCFGQIVRKVPPAGRRGETGLAATIEEYLLMQAEEATQS
jgi:hypothetical protein